jgi:hypothetical protein
MCTACTAVFDAPAEAAPGTLSKAAIVSLVAGLVCCVPVASPAVAIVSGVMALADIRDNHKGGMPLAIIGIALGILGALFQVFMLIGALADAS